MSRPARWWWGLLPLAAAWAGSAWLKTAEVEQDLAQRAKEAVAPAMGDVAVTAAGRDVTLSGQIFTPGSTAAGVAAADATRGVRLVTNETAPPPPAKPFVWSASREGDKVTLTGSVPDPQTRAKLLAEAGAALPNATVIDEMTYASGVAPGFAAGAGFALAQLATLSKGSVSLSDASFGLAGEAPSLAAYQALTAATKTLPQGLTLGRVGLLPPIMDPFAWEAASDGRIVTLSGGVASEEVRARILAAARAGFPDLAIDDRMQLAGGGPEGDQAAALAEVGLMQLAKLDEGHLALRGGSLSLGGTARPGVDAGGIAGELASALPAGITLGGASIAAPAAPALPQGYAFDARKADGKLTLTGNYPDEATHQAILDQARQLFFGEDVDDRLTQAPSAPEGYGDAVRAGLGQLARLGGGGFTLAGGSARLTGDALYDRAAGDVQSELAATLPGGYAPDAAITVRAAEAALDAAACQEMLRLLLDRSTIEFETARASLTRDSAGLLDHLVATVQRCPDARIEIAGHTDSSGSDAINLPLSRERAQAVMDYLERAGVPAGKLSAVRHGSSQPIASNDTEKGKARNRRIEFIVK